jgi:leucyl/phenylalanyl-tRNA--protein transferase
MLRFVPAQSWPPISPDLIIAAYLQGIFPMADEKGKIGWYSPDPRAIFPLDAFHVPHSLRKTIRKNPFEMRYDSAFRQVMQGCGDRDPTWINEKIIDNYTLLFDRGMGHSVEAWQDGKLVGGLYGVAIGAAFMGESMFNRVTDAAKVCLVFLVERLKEKGFTLLDSQMPTDHLLKYGQILITRTEYLRRLDKAVKRKEVKF